MEIHPLGKRNMLIYLNSDELEGLSAPLMDIKSDEAADILKTALGGDCGEEWENVYLELYAGKDSLLLFARVHSGNPSFFTFEELEQLILAVDFCPSGIISFLFYCGELYYLVTYPWDNEPPPGVLYEYGEVVNQHPHYALFLTEHGKKLLGPSAIDELKKVF